MAAKWLSANTITLKILSKIMVNDSHSYKDMGYELKPNVHGVAWLYNGFNINQSVKNMNGALYANQIAAMYAGFGRDAHKDTVLTLDVLGG
jgi:hypothetical protein